MVRVKATLRGIYNGRLYEPGDTFYAQPGALDVWMETIPEGDEKTEQEHGQEN